MKTLYLECNMGAAGDMLMAALSELVPDPDAFVAKMNALGLPGVRVERQKSEKCGIVGTHMAVTVDGAEEHSHDVHDHEHDHHHEHEHDHHHDHERDHDHDHDHHHDHDHGQPAAGGCQCHCHDHHHAGMDDICRIIGGLDVPEAVKVDAAAVYGLIAMAEAQAHGRPVAAVHFHEVGALDAVADVVGACLLMHEIAPEQVIVSPVHVGSGEVRCAHGVLPVPAPATARILEGAPIYGGGVRGELCTPTGAALLKHFATRFGDMPAMALERTGYGMGGKDFERANCLRAMLGETAEPGANACDPGGAPGETACELRCNLDDMTGEEIAFAAEALRSAGALDVWTEAVGMKKGRPGVLLACLCAPEREAEFAALMLRHTTTIGVRGQTVRRYTLAREEIRLDTPRGPVRAKRSRGYGVDRVKPEYDDLAGIARRENLPLRDVLK